MKLKNLFQCLSIICLITLTGPALAATTITYQGQLEANDTPFDGEVNLTFSLFNAESGGSMVGSSITLNDVEVSRGLFQVKLDFGEVFDSDPLWIQIAVDETTVLPRQPITTVPVAQYALSGPSGDSAWNVSGSNIWYSGGNVGIGTSSPSAALEVSGRAAFGNSVQATGGNSFAGGGGHNTASGIHSFVGGGGDNNATQLNSFVGGGSNNTASSTNSFVAGGGNNIASGNSSFASGSGAEASGEASFAGGGANNQANGVESFVAGGRGNEAGGRGAFVGAGIDNVADGQFSFAAGRRALAQHDGSFVWASGSWSNFNSTAQNQFLIRANGGVGINTNNPEAALHVLGHTAIGSFAADHRLGVGTSNPWNTLHVVSNDDQGPLRVMVGNNSNASTVMRGYPHQGVSIGHSWTDSDVPERGMRVRGELWLDEDIYIDATWMSAQSSSKVCAELATGHEMIYRLYTCPNGDSSSRRYKKDIQPLKSASDLIERMQAVSFRWKESGEEDIGLVAEDMAKIEPRLVFDNERGEIEGINYSHLTAVLVRAMQERREMVDAELTAMREEYTDELEARDQEIAALRRELDEQRRSYEDRLAALESILLDGSQVAEKRPLE